MASKLALALRLALDHGAYLREADLGGANLRGADLRGSINLALPPGWRLSQAGLGERIETATPAEA